MRAATIRDGAIAVEEHLDPEPRASELLVRGAAGGVGMAAVQLGTMAGARVTATVRNDHCREQVSALGINALAPDEFVDAGPFDVILELVGAPNFPGNLRALAA